MRGELNLTGRPCGQAYVRILVLGCCLSLLLFAVLSLGTALAAPLSPSSPLYNPGGSPIVNENFDIVVEYQGSITETFETPPIQGSKSSDYLKAQLKWDETVAGPVDQIEYTGVYGASSIHWRVNSLTGEVKDKGTEEDGKAFGCEGTFSANSADGGEGGVFVPLETPGHPAGGGDPATNPDYSVRPPLGLPASLVLSSGPAGPDAACVSTRWNSTLGDSAWGDAVDFASEEPAVGTAWGDTVYPTVYFPPGGGHTQSLPFSYTCAPPKCGTEGGIGAKAGLVSASVESSITFSSPGLGTGTPVTKKSTPAGGGGGPLPPITCGAGSKPTCQDKKLAQEDLRSQLPGLANECAIATIGLGGLVVGAAAPEIGIASVLAAAGPTGAEIVALAGPVCGLLIKRIYDDAKIIEDPPIGGLRKLARPARPKGPAARLPACASSPAAIKVFCEKLRGDALRYARALRTGTAIDTALLTTVDRISGAYKAHSKAALALQQRQASGLRASFSAARREQRRAGAAIIKLVKSVGLQASLTAAQEQAGINSAFSKLAKLGVSGAQAQRLGGTTLTTGPTDALGQLGH